MRQPLLRPTDVAVALQLAIRPRDSYPELAKAVGISLGQAYNAVQRLRGARLVVGEAREVVRPALLDFLIAGVPYAFPAQMGQTTRGVPTAHSAAPLAQEIRSNDVVVWPSGGGARRGSSLIPLYPGAPQLPSQNPRLYELLTLVDALRIGRARERARAQQLLRARLAVAKAS